MVWPWVIDDVLAAVSNSRAILGQVLFDLNNHLPANLAQYQANRRSVSPSRNQPLLNVRSISANVAVKRSGAPRMNNSRNTCIVASKEGTRLRRLFPTLS